MTDKDEFLLIERLKIRDREAFRLIVKKYHANLVYMAKVIVGEAFAEEIVQDTWETVLSSIHNFQQRSTLKTWITQIVINKAKTRQIREARHSSLDFQWQDSDDDKFEANGTWSSPPQPWHADSPEALLLSDELHNSIYQRIEQLPYNQRMTIILHDIEGIGFDEICNIIEVSQSNVRVLLHRARLAIKQVIDEHQN